ncbi:CAP domain-containing protein [Amycolatopsis sp. NPDC088138]|uniref:CAP domain-containing protein n=1 Tax=Amycolatopsis sp. NPDC088138 TaxID=3363938 RepID=UPI00382147D9
MFRKMVTCGVVALALVPGVAAPASAGDLYPAQVLQLTNSNRVQNGCKPLTADPQLAVAAQAHNDEMAKYRYFSHTGRKGENPAARITDAGYRWAQWAENIAAGQRTPTAVVDAWMHSPVHRANILDCSLREIGIAYSVDSAKKAYWTQDFGTPRT